MKLIRKMTMTVCTGLIAFGWISVASAAMVTYSVDGNFSLWDATTSTISYSDFGGTIVVDSNVFDEYSCSGFSGPGYCGSYNISYNFVADDSSYSFSGTGLLRLGSLIDIGLYETGFPDWFDEAGGKPSFPDPLPDAWHYPDFEIGDLPAWQVHYSGALGHPDNVMINGLPTNAASLSMTIIPVPPAFWLMASGLVALLGVARSRCCRSSVA